MVNRSKQKGDRVEREIVAKMQDMNIKSERMPLSGALSCLDGKLKGDIDIYLFGAAKPPLKCEVKARKNGNGFAVIDGWLGNNDLLFLKKDRNKPMVVLSWDTWAQLCNIITIEQETTSKDTDNE
ncbi:MAG: hypothetical protein AB8B77_06400 [Alphaproteobacteria bacterium]